MKTVFLASVAAATLIAAPAFAQDAVGSAGIGYVHSDTEGFKTDGAQLDGVGAFKVAPEWTVTVNGAVNYADSDFGDDTTAAAAAHLTKTFGSDLRVGGFAGVTDLGDDETFTVGAEVQKYLASATLTGLVSYSDLDGADAWTIGGDAAYYVNPSFRLNAGVSYSNVDADLGEADVWAYGAGAEYQFANSPFSVTGTYQRVSSDFANVDVDADVFMIGARYNFGGTLQSLDRAGANLGRTLAGLPVIRGF
ncbi:MAG TPA: porin [Brevundimonas sp.]|nr:porin [Brevundimonas sp.]